MSHDLACNHFLCHRTVSRVENHALICVPLVDLSLSFLVAFPPPVASSDHFQLPLSRFSSVSSSSYAITSHANAKTANDPGPLALDQDFSADNQGDLDQDSNSDGNSIASSIAYSLEYLSDGEAPHQLNSDNDNNLNNINNSQLVHLPPTPNASSIINSDNHDPSSTTGLPPSGLLMPSNTSSSNNSSDNVGGLPITDGRVVGGVNVDGAGGGDDGRDQADNEDGIEEMNIGDEGGDGEGEGGAGEAEVIENKPENTIRPGAGAGEHASLADGTGGTGGRDRNDMDEDDEDEDDLFAFEVCALISYTRLLVVLAKFSSRYGSPNPTTRDTALRQLPFPLPLNPST